MKLPTTVATTIGPMMMMDLAQIHVCTQFGKWKFYNLWPETYFSFIDRRRDQKSTNALVFKIARTCSFSIMQEALQVEMMKTVKTISKTIVAQDLLQKESSDTYLSSEDKGDEPTSCSWEETISFSMSIFTRNRSVVSQRHSGFGSFLDRHCVACWS
eukprot:scaffold1184_cov132-Cylindrotheca_fusiformis.AAC.60